MTAAAKPSPLFPPTRTLRVDSAGTPTLEQEGVAVIRGNWGSRYSMPYGTLAIYCSLTDALICFCTNLCLYTHAFGGAGLGDTPGHPPLFPPLFLRSKGGSLPISRPRPGRGCGPAFCVFRHWASRTRAVSLLTGEYTPQLALYLIKETPQNKV